jgi:hypothetical protein
MPEKNPAQHCETACNIILYIIIFQFIFFADASFSDDEIERFKEHEAVLLKIQAPHEGYWLTRT